MGIPSYYKKLCDSIPGLKTRKNPFGKCQYMWLDFNCMVYHCLRRPGAIPYKGEETRLVWEAQFIQSVCLYLEKIVRICEPSKGVFVAVDGVVPMAKIRQQRLRRFKSHWTHAEEVRLGKSGNEPRWDTNAITPGTAFMEKLAIALKETAKRHSSWTISCADEPGEGEQKVMAAMRQLDPLETQGHIIYGLDADLILLSLLQEREGRQIALFRESVECGEVQYDGDEEIYTFLSIPLLANAICHVKNRNQYLLDYCMAMSLLGNDFLPHGLSLTLRNDGHAILLQLLQEHSGLVNETGWNKEKLEQCFEWISKKEEMLLKKAISFKKRIQYSQAQGQGVEKEYDEWTKTPLRVFDEVSLVQKFEREPVLRHDWKKIYTERYLENHTKCEEEYIRGLNWIFHYYMGHPVSFDWMYPWHLPPLWSNLLDFIKHNPISEQEAWKEPIRPQEQLALVLPKTSWWLVRDPMLRELPKKNPALWPDRFPLFMAGKRAMWECEAKIPLFTPIRLRFLLGLAR